MAQPVPVIVSWSGGKDSALALSAMLSDERYKVQGLLTSVNDHYRRVSMHGVRETLLDQQAASIGLPLYKIRLTEHPSNLEYEDKMRAAMQRAKTQGIQHVVFGDLFLDEIRSYRIENMRPLNMQCLFPLWHRPTGKLAQEFLDMGFKAVLCCVDKQTLDGSFAGRNYDSALLRDLPASVDPCGENGEFHTFVYAGPILPRPVAYRLGECVCRDNRFQFCDLIPTEAYCEHLETAVHH